ncbi:autotransporter domain-containing protein [Pseudomonas japonica]
MDNGYTLNGGIGGELVLSAGSNILRVDPGVTGTLGVAINGAGTLVKEDGGTLVLNGANGYTGGTALNRGTLVVGNNGALGTGDLTAAAGTTLDSNTAVTLANNTVLNGGLSIGGSNALTLDGVVSGAGSLTKNGSANLTLNGVNTYTGGTVLNGGSVTLGNNAALSSGTVSVTGASLLDSTGALQLANALNLTSQLTLAGSQDTTLSGVISGTGSLVKNGNGSLLLSGANTYGGGTTINAGSVTGDTTSLQGAITNNGALTFAQNADGTYSGNLSGAGTLTKSGTGQLLLTGTSGFTGNTLVSAGSLVNNGTLASANVQVASGASLGGSGTYSGTVTIADGASLNAGTATAPLSVGNLNLSSGSNLNFALGAPGGSTTVVAVAGNLVLDGTLNISNAGGFGQGVYQLFTYGGSVTDNGLAYGTLPAGTTLADLTLQTAIANQINLVVGSNLLFWNGSKTTGDGTVSGGTGTWASGTTNWTNTAGTSSNAWNDTFAVFGGDAGTVTVAGQQSFTGLQFLTDGYTVQAGTGGALQAVNSAGGDLAAVRVGTGTAVISAPLVGTGGIEKLDAGTLYLAGANTYTGGTTVSGGTLMGNTTSLQGNITNNANLVFAQGSSGQFSGILSGNGSISKQGTGDLLIVGSQPFNGAFSVDQGSVIVGNAANPGTVFGAQVTVGTNGTLAGTGSVGSLVNNGSVVTGLDGGNLSVAGNFSNAGTLTIALTPSLTNYLNVGGTANLGGTLNVANLGSYSGDTQYTLVSATGGVSGTFASNNLTQLAFLDTTLNYGANAVTLDVARNGTAFASVAQTDNQREVAAALESAAAPASLRNAVISSTASSAVATFESLSGEIYASTATVLIEDSRYIRDAVNDRMRQAGCSDEQDPRNTLAPTSNQQTTGRGCSGEGVGWIRAVGGWGDFDGGHNAANVDRDLSGFLIGFDNNLNDQWRAGIAAGYTNSSINAKGKGQDASVDSYHLATYLSYQMDAFAARLGAGYTWHDIDSKRYVQAGDYNDRLKSSYKARTAQVFGEVGYAIDANGVALEPFAGLAYVNHDSDKAREKGGVGRLEANTDQDVVFSTVGLRVGKSFTLDNGATLTPRGSIGWRHAFGDTKPDADLRFVEGGAGFSNSGVPIARDAAVVEAGVDLSVGAKGKLGLGYSGQLASESRDNAVTVSFSLEF